MQYSDVLKQFYKISIKPEYATIANAHYNACCHHHTRMLECESDSKEHKFHHIRFKAHLRGLLVTVYRHGDFKYAEDLSLRGMEDREAWNPEHYTFPDLKMFEGKPADPSVPEHGKEHPLDKYLKEDFSPPIPAPSMTKTGAIHVKGRAGQS